MGFAALFVCVATGNNIVKIKGTPGICSLGNQMLIMTAIDIYPFAAIPTKKILFFDTGIPNSASQI